MGAVEAHRRPELGLRVQAQRPAAETLRLVEANVEKAPSEPLALEGRPEPHALELARARREQSHSRGAHDLLPGIHHEQEHARGPVILLLPVRDVVVEAVGIERVADEGEVRGQLARHGDMIVPARAADGEVGRHALLRAWEASPRSHRYSVSPPFLPTHREGTKTRSLSRFP